MTKIMIRYDITSIGIKELNKMMRIINLEQSKRDEQSYKSVGWGL